MGSLNLSVNRGWFCGAVYKCLTEGRFGLFIGSFKIIPGLDHKNIYKNKKLKIRNL